MGAISKVPNGAPDAQDYIARISVQLEKTIKSFVEIGRLLSEAHDTLGRKAWLEMVTDDLPFTRRTAEKLIKISSDLRLTNPKHMAKLPPHWTSLHELTLLSDEQLEYGFSENIISPDAERKHITALKEWQPGANWEGDRTAPYPKSTKRASHTMVSQPASQVVGAAFPPEVTQSGFTAFLSLPPDTRLSEARLLFDEISAVSARYSATLKISPHYQHLFDVHEEAQKYMRSAREEFRHGSKGNDLSAIRDAFFQLGTGKKLAKNADGSPNSRDIASLDHTYGELELQGLAGYCQDLQIVTQYTPIADIDPYAYESQLVLICLDGNPKERDSALTMLSELAKKSARAARFIQVLNAQ